MAKMVKAQAWRSKYEPGAKIRRGATVRSVLEKGVDFGYLREVERRGLIEINP